MESKSLPKFKPLLDFASKEYIGERDGQEDYSSIRPMENNSEILMVLADGMGGHNSGEVASKKSVDAFDETFKNYPGKSISAKLGASLHNANLELEKSIIEIPALEGMGCTLVGVHISLDGLQWISVGDSPLFVYRNKKLLRLNADHSMTPVIEESVRKGRMTLEEAKSHPQRHALRSALSGGELAFIDIPNEAFKLLSGDVVILASDGILSLNDQEICKVINASTLDAESIATNLINEVKNKRKPRQDNTSILVFKAPERFFTAPKSNSLTTAIYGIISLLVISGILYVTLIDKKIIGFYEKENKVDKPIIQPQPTPVNMDHLADETKSDDVKPSNSNNTSTNKDQPIIEKRDVKKHEKNEEKKVKPGSSKEDKKANKNLETKGSNTHNSSKSVIEEKDPNQKSTINNLDKPDEEAKKKVIESLKSDINPSNGNLSSQSGGKESANENKSPLGPKKNEVPNVPQQLPSNKE